MDIEKAARDLLRERGFTCEFYVPDRIPPYLVTVKLTSQPGSDRFLGRAMLTVQAWAGERGKAGVLCCNAIDALLGRGDFEGLGGLEAAHADITECNPENGPYRFDDPDVKDRKRWQATVSVCYNA